MKKMIIPPHCFEILKKILFLQVSFCEANEERSKNILSEFCSFTNEKFKLIIRLKTCNLKSSNKNLDIRSTIILVGSMNHQNIYIKILTMCLPV